MPRWRLPAHQASDQRRPARQAVRWTDARRSPRAVRPADAGSVSARAQGVVAGPGRLRAAATPDASHVSLRGEFRATEQGPDAALLHPWAWRYPRSDAT